MPVRLFHWLLALGILAAFAIAQFGGEHGSLFAYHSMIGIVVGMMVVLRIVWGVIGTRYARFGSFVFSPGAVVEYLKGVFGGNTKRHVGHNPASSYAIYAMLGLVIVIVGSGLLMSGGNEAFEEIHSIATYVLLAVVAVHVVGVILHTVKKRENLTGSMFTGRKVAEPDAAIRSSAPVSGAVFVVLIVIVAQSLYRNYDAASRKTKLPLLGTVIQLNEADDGESESKRSRHREHDD